LPAAVVFDFGAVLFQWQPLQLLQQVVPELAGDEVAARALAASIFESFTPDSDWAQFDLGRIDEAALATRISRRIGATAPQMRRVIDAIPPHLQPQQPTVELFRQMKARGHRMYFLSNMPLPYASILEQQNAFVAEFEDGIFSSRVGLMKPHAEIFDLAQKRFSLEPGRTVFIDDHAGNIDAALAQGWQGVRFVEAAQCAEDLRRLGW
jgi:HAD superfamily hydrolase (TIGR01509 family)